MACRLSDVADIIDMDGFMVNERSYCKELGMVKFGEAAARSVLFDTGLRWGDLSQKDRRTCKYVMQHIHNLSFGVPWGVEPVEVSALMGIVCDFYQSKGR